MSEDRQRVLSMVAQGKLSIEEAEKLLDLLQKNRGKEMQGESQVILECLLSVI